MAARVVLEALPVAASDGFFRGGNIISFSIFHFPRFSEASNWDSSGQQRGCSDAD